MQHAGFLPSDSPLADMVAHHPWHDTQLGPIEHWPQSLKTIVSLVMYSPLPMIILWGPEGVMIYNDGYATVAGTRHPEILGQKVLEGWPEVADFNKSVMEKVLGGGRLSYQDQLLTLHRTGKPEPAWLTLDYSPIIDESGKPAGVLAVVIDTTTKIKTQQRLDGERERLRRLFEMAPGFMAIFSGENHIVQMANESYLDLVGRRDIVGMPLPEALPELRSQGLIELIERVRENGHPYVARGRAIQLDTRFQAENRQRIVDFVLQPIKDDDGLVTDVFVQGHDVTETYRVRELLERANEELEDRVAAEIAERAKAEELLRHTQKMEALGQLTGGVAHDFNNLLQVIGSNLQLLYKDIGENERAEKRIENALAGVNRGSKLAHQLLSFGRRLPLDPRVINIGRFIASIEELLRRTLGEAVEIEIIRSGGLWNTLVDPTQIENAILNLAINARDAMEEHGRLTIEIGNAYLDDLYVRRHSEVKAGQYVMMAVTDTGSGMPPDIVSQVFEPFFSTKPVGKGTGLGLSMVYGFVKQSGGHIKIYSEVGQGTTVKLYFPRVDKSEDIIAVADSGPVSGGTETILVAEDDEDVRLAVVELLRDLGYNVLKARDATGALHVIESGAAIDLLFTDVVMPGPLRSADLARQARERIPNLAVLFTSGYTENSIVHGGRLDQGVELLSKPYTREALARKIRHVLTTQKAQNAAQTEIDDRKNDMNDTTAKGPLKILFVEDEPLIRMAAVDMIEDLGHTATEAGRAEEALEALGRETFDIVITDLGLPGMSGADLAREILRRYNDLPLIFATGDVRGPDLGGSRKPIILPKPYEENDIRAAISAALEEWAR